MPPKPNRPSWNLAEAAVEVGNVAEAGFETDLGDAVVGLDEQSSRTMDDLKPLLASGLEGGRDFESGRDSFGSSTCYACHRFNDEGGSIGPDLTSARGKFSHHDLLEQIIDPSNEIPDQYGSMVFKMMDGSVVNGRIANLRGTTTW